MLDLPEGHVEILTKRKSIQAHGPVMYVHEVRWKCVRSVLAKRPTGPCRGYFPKTDAEVLHSMIETESRLTPQAPSSGEAVNETPSIPDPVHAPDVEVAATPLPKLQLFILLYLQLAEPITSTVIYPFVNQLVRETGITSGDERKTGYFAGLIVSALVLYLSLLTMHVAHRPDNHPRNRASTQ